MKQFSKTAMNRLFAVSVLAGLSSVALGDDLASAASRNGPPRLPSFGQSSTPHPPPRPKTKKIVAAPAATAVDSGAIATEVRVYRGNGSVPKDSANVNSKEGQARSGDGRAPGQKGDTNKDNKTSLGTNDKKKTNAVP